ncbi:MAG: hypothetical protein A2624_05015, partial [Gammaproteobacteria bacterium RIFCSPHIGHO2_01_FULL_42_8]
MSNIISEQQPSVIPVFFATEMWERFGFYMIQGLLVLYMTSKVFGFSDEKSYGILGAFTALAYITPIIGGYVASRILDFEHAITLGGVLLAIGYVMLALPTEHWFYISLAVITTGTGFFKPNISSYLGDFYDKDNPYREKGYTIFYIGINLGILLSTSTSGYLVRYFGWHVPFVMASIGLLIGTATFLYGTYYLKSIHNFNRIKPSIAHKNPIAIASVYIGMIVLTVLSYEIIRHRSFADELMLWGGAAVFIGLIIQACRFASDVRNKMIACVLLTIVSIVFWAIYFQMFFSMNLFVERAVDRNFFSWHLPAPLFLSLESIYIILFGGFFAYLWLRLSKSKKNPSTPFKFALSMFMLFIAFIILYASTRLVGADGQSDKIFIVFAYWFVMAGE